MAKPGPKHKTVADREAYRAELSICYRKGWFVHRMMEKFSKSRRQIQRDCRLLDQRCLDAQVKNVSIRRAQEVAKIGLVETEAWTAWDRSKEAAETRTQKMRKAEPGGAGSPIEATIKTEDQSGDATYLRLVLEATRERRKVLGTDSPDRSSTDDYSGLSDEEIDERIARIDRLEAAERGEAVPPRGADGSPEAPAGGSVPEDTQPAP